MVVAFAKAAGTDYFTGNTLIDTTNEASPQTKYLFWEQGNNVAEVVGTEDNYIWKIETQSYFE